MQMTITGATGFIGKRLIARLLEDGNSVNILARRNPHLDSRVRYACWDALQNEPPAEMFDRADAVVHLAGEPVAQRWTPAAVDQIRRTRLDGTRRLVETLSTLRYRPKALIAASAIGYYGDRGDEELDEGSAAGRGFLPELSAEWEKQATLAEALGIRVVRLRIGIVLGAEGGALARMLPPFRLGAGGRLGSGRQWMSWIHVDDLVELIRFAATSDAFRGPVNAVSPGAVTNSEFTRELARALKRPAFFPVPAFALRILFGRMSSILLESQRVRPRAATAAGFSFRFPELGAALEDLVRPPA